MNRIRPWIAIAMIAVAVLGAGALLVTIYATEQRVRVDQQLPDLVGDVSETTAAVNRVNEELYRTNAELFFELNCSRPSRRRTSNCCA